MSERYERYLNSDHWRKVRIKRLLVAELRENPTRVQCERCKLWLTFTVCRGTSPALMTPGFAIHHKTYERLGAERMEDLEVLCHGCHARHHGYTAPLWWYEAIAEKERLGEFTVTREFIRASPDVYDARKVMIDALVALDRKMGELCDSDPIPEPTP